MKIKKYIYSCLLLFTFCIIFNVNSQAQVIKAAANLGFNATQVDGDEIYGYYKFGANAGLQAIMPIKKNFYFSVETAYSQKGSHQRAQFDDSLSGEYNLVLDYLEIPILLHYVDKEKYYFGTGISYGRLVNFNESEHGRLIPWKQSEYPYKSNDFEWIFNFNFPIINQLHFDFRYQYSIAKIRTRLFTRTGEIRDQYNNILSFRLSYIINESKGKRKKK